MLFKIERNKSVFETNKELSNIAEFADLSDKQMRYVMFYADFKSPYRAHNDTERKRLSAIEAGYSIQNGHQKTLDQKAREIMDGRNEKVNKAILKYRSLAPNEDREQLMLYTTQIQSIRKLVEKGSEDAAELKKINDLLTSLPDLKKSQRELAKSIGMEDELAKIEEEAIKNRSRNMIDIVATEELSQDEDS
jgi:hypothetical protein